MTTIKGLDDLQRKFKTLENFQRKLKAPMEESASLVVDYMATAPRKKKGAFTQYATPGQKRAYWAKVSSGEIEQNAHGYKRTSTLVTGWNYKIKTSSRGIKAEVGNKKAKGWGHYVQGAEQQLFHKASGWRTTDEAIKKTANEVQKIFDKAIKRELNR